VKIKNNLLVLGDIHAELSVIYNHIDRFELQHCSIIQVGDFGYAFTNDQLQELNKFLKSKNITLYINRGNHDNYYNHFNHFSKLNTSEYKKNLSHIHFLCDFHTIIYNDKRILTIGGATSIDRVDRISDVSWWEREKINYNKIQFDTKPDTFRRYMFDEYTKNIDIVISHTAPGLLHPYLKLKSLQSRYEKDPTLEQDLIDESQFLNKLVDIIEPKQWYCGHFHQSVTTDIDKTKFCVLNINELKAIVY
jgi:hypothetical protein